MYTPNESSVLGGTAMKETIERYQGDFFDVYTITRMKLYKHELPIENDKEKISRLYGYSFQETESVFELLDKELMELQQVVKNKCNLEIERCKKNIDGNIYNAEDNIADILSKHIKNPVRFTLDLQKMYDSGIDLFVEIGPGRTLSGFVKRMKFERPIKIMNINNCESLEEFIKEVKNNE